MPQNPTKNVPDDERLPTASTDVGRVAPDFQDRKHFNSLLIRPTYRVTLKLGDIESLFPTAPGTRAGRMARLQALGLFYYPLNHAQAVTAFDGVPAQAGPATPGAPPPAPAVPGVWQHFKTRVLNNATDAAADAEIQKMLKERILDGGKLPVKASDPAAPANDNFAKIRIPGGYSLLKSWQGNALDLNDDPSAAYAGWTLGKDVYSVETRFRIDNPLLGKIPLVALAEKWNDAERKWEPAPDAWVHFQLVKPYALPAFAPGTDVNAQFNRPPLRASTVGPPANAAGVGPAKFAAPEETPTGARAQNADDPQFGNCPKDRGGLQGQGSLANSSDVSGVIFETTSRPGFNAAHTAAGAPAMPHDPYPVARKAGTAPHHHAVKAKTNAKGEAGAIFTPSRCGGDRYRLRAYVGPPTVTGPAADPSGMDGASVETGTLVNWRNLRVSRYVRMTPANPHANLLTDYTTNISGSVNDNPKYLNRVLTTLTGANPGLPTVSMSLRVNPAASFDSMPVNFARAFVEVEIDRAAQGQMPETLTAADWQGARDQAWRDAVQGLATLGLNLDLPRLFHLEAGSPITVGNAVVALPMRSPAAYNQGKAAADPQRYNAAAAAGNNQRNVGRLVKQYMETGFLRFLSHNGYTSGLTLVQAPHLATWVLPRWVSSSSGTSFEYRGGTLFFGNLFYPTTITAPTAGQLGYDGTSNGCHEWGHVLYRLHGPGSDPGGNAGGGNSIARHDSLTTGGGNESICVMSYKTCEGQFCAKCLLAYRGWNVTTIP